MREETFAPVPNRGMITILTMLANIMQGVDNTILNVALPHIQGSLSASLEGAGFEPSVPLAKGRGTLFRAVHRSKDPTVFTALFEDSAALLGWLRAPER